MNKLVVSTLLLVLVQAYYSELSAATPTVLSKSQQETISQTQVPFVKNEGQIKPDYIKFYAQTFNGTIFISDTGDLIYTITDPKDYLGAEDYLMPDGSFSGRHVFALSETPLTDKQLQIKGLNQASTSVNCFIGDDPKNWRSNIQTYNLITLGEAWDGITINLKTNYKNIEKVFIITPDGNPDSIIFSVTGVKELQLTTSGELELVTQNKSIGFTAPIAYQEINGDKKSVEVSFRLIDKTKYGFTVGHYDKTIPLVIDPLLSSTFIGGFGTDYARAIAIDPVNGNVFVAGYTQGTPTFVWQLGGWIFPNNFPTQGETPLTPYNSGSSPLYNGAYYGGGSSDIVICKFNPTLTTLIASTYLGGPGSDGAYGIALDGGGNVFVCGFAGPGFPTLTDRPSITLASGLQFTPTARDDTYNGPSVLGLSQNPNDGIIAKMSNSLNALLAATYHGGSANGSLTADSCTGIVIDGSNNVFVCGFTDGSNFPTNVSINYLSGSSSLNYNGGNDAFVSKFNNNLSGPTGRQDEFYFASLFIGGSPTPQLPGTDIANAIVLNTLDESSSIYITGFTTPGAPQFPTTGGALNTAYDRTIQSTDAFVSQFSNDLRTLQASTYLGGDESADVAYAITLGPLIGDGPTVYITGSTASSDFPVTNNSAPYWNPYAATVPGLGAQDVFVSRLTYDLRQLVNSTWIGGVDSETSFGICAKGTDIYICGQTNSSDFPTTPDAFAITNTGGAGDVFVSCFNETLSILNASTMIGGPAQEIAFCIQPDNTGNIIYAGIAGQDYPTWPITGTNAAYDTSFNGSGDIFITRITADLSGGFSQQAQPLTPGEVIDYGSDGIIAGSSGLAYFDKNAFKQSCFIATAVYGNQTHPNVITLRNFRDKYLMTNELGKQFVKWYYRSSPPFAQYLKKAPLQAAAVRCALTPLVYTIRYPVLIPLIGGLLLIVGYRLSRRKTKKYSAV